MRLRHGFAACVLAGCGSISDNGNNIDAAVITDTTAPTVMSSSPANSDKGVRTITPLSFFFDESIDPASVTADTVKLTYLPLMPAGPYLYNLDIFFLNTNVAYQFGEQPIRGTVSYDDAGHKVSFVPAAPLPRAVRVTATLAVKDVAGNMHTGMPIQFQTAINNEKARFGFNTTTGVPASWQEFGPGMNGRMDRRVVHNNAGADGIWHTMDDNTSSRLGVNWSDDGRILEERQYGAGPDGKLNTADDVVNQFGKFAYDAMGRLTERYYSQNPGADAMYGTADDLPLEVQTMTYDAMGRPLATVLFYEAGSDTVFRTADDRCSNYTEFQYNAAGMKTRDVFRSCGADELPKTADDTISQYKDYQYDENGNLKDITSFYNPGPDNVFFTVDDLGFARYTFELAANGVPEKINYYGGPGPDNRWRTADDILSQIEKDTLDDHGLVTVQDFYNSGPDGVLGTPDDNITNYLVTTYDENGSRVDQKTYFPGLDAMAHTADDPLSVQLRFDTAH